MLLFVNACFREDSRTERLARAWLRKNAAGEEVVEVDLATSDVAALDVHGANPVAAYCRAVDMASYDHPMFDAAKQFARADHVLIAAPLWNFGLPARLHDYLELVCSQGVTFDVGATGQYESLCRMWRLTFVTTGGGLAPLPEDDHAFGYLRTLANRFWFVPHVEQVAAWGLNAQGADVDALLAAALQ